MIDLLREWYTILSRPSQALAIPIGDLATGLGVPAASAFLFGLIGAVAPCQLTTGASAMAYLSRRGARPSAALEAVLFVLGKAVVYVALGAVVLLLGTRVPRGTVGVAIVTRKALGPLLVLMGLAFLGAFRLRGGFGVAIAERLKARLPASGPLGAFLVGVAFALGFCPTLFWLFFGLTLPLAVGHAAGVVFPALFALGTGVPVLVAGAALSAGASLDAGRRLERASRVLTRIAGLVLVVLGLNDTLVYWTL